MMEIWNTVQGKQFMQLQLLLLLLLLVLLLL